MSLFTFNLHIESFTNVKLSEKLSYNVQTSIYDRKYFIFCSESAEAFNKLYDDMCDPIL